MKIINSIILTTVSLIFVACGGGWTSEQKDELMKDCPKNDQAACKCGSSVIMEELTYDEYIDLRSNRTDFNKEKAKNLESRMIDKCGE